MGSLAIPSSVSKHRKISRQGYILREVTFACLILFVFPDWGNSRAMEVRGTLRRKNGEEGANGRENVERC